MPFGSEFVEMTIAAASILTAYDFEIVWPTFYKQLPDAIDEKALIAAIRKRLEDMDEEDIEILLLH